MKMFKSPPEVILRPLVRRARLEPKQSNHNAASHSLVTRNVSSSNERFYRVAVCTELGKPMVMSKVAAQEVFNDQVRVKIHAAAVSFGDLLTVQGTYQEKLEPPFTPGSEFSGVITELGPDVKNVTVGTRVCGLTYGNAYGEEVVITEANVFEIPDSMSYTVAAGFMSSYGTAILALEIKARLQKGEKVLITAAAGAVGLAAMDLAKNVYGAEVIGAAGGPEKCKLVQQYGATSIDYKTENIRTKVRSIHPSGVDVVFESVGGDVFKDCFRSLGTDGRLLIIGFASGQHPTLQANHMLVKNVSVLGVYWGSYKILNPDLFKWTVQECMKYFNEGKIHPRVGATFKLEEVNEAFDYIKGRKAMGKVVLTMT